MTIDNNRKQSSLVFDKLIANVRLRMCCRASGLPGGLNRHTVLHVQRDRFLTAVNVERSQTGEDLVTVLERCDGSMAHWFLCGVAGLSARVVGGVRMCARRFSPGVGVNRRKRCGSVCLQAEAKLECFAGEETKYEVGSVCHAGAVQETVCYMDFVASKFLQNSVMTLLRGHSEESTFRRIAF